MSVTKVVHLGPFIQKHPRSVALLLERRDNVVCRSKTNGKTKTVQFRALFENNRHFWDVQGSWDYFLDTQSAEEILDRIHTQVEAEALELPRVEQTPTEDTPPVQPAEQAAEHDNFGGTFQRYSSLTTTERVGILEKTETRLKELAADPAAEPEEVAEALIEGTEQATMINRATLFEALKMGDEEARRYSREMVAVTDQMVRSTIRLVDSDVYDDDLVGDLVQRSNGTVVQHMTRVFLRGLQFLLHYNRGIIRHGIASKIRIHFPKRYRPFYAHLLPHIYPEDLTLERVFYGGMKSLSEEEIHSFATGFLIHDVGKAEDIEYHEGTAGYDRAIVERHVKLGYRAIMNKSNYPREAALITGHHHEYYGDPDGYGYFREFLQAYKDANPDAIQKYVMSYTMEPMIDYEVLAFFPAKVLEIVDVYDSLTDPNRLYRAPLGRLEALEMMNEEFVRKHSKLDPILFDMFLDFCKG